MRAKGKDLHCLFCGKSQDEVIKLIAGPSIFICNECVGLCNAILDEPENSDGKALTICRFCGNNGELEQMLDIAKKGFICQDCMPVVYEEIRQRYLKE